MSLSNNSGFRTSLLAYLTFAAFLVGCANSGHRNTLSGQGANEVEIDGVIYVVSKTDKDIYSATHRDWLKHNLVVRPAEFIKRKVDFTMAIEKSTGCKVVVSHLEENTGSLSASVACN